MGRGSPSGSATNRTRATNPDHPHHVIWAGGGGRAMAMIPFSSVDRSTLRWLRTAESPIEFTLSSGDSPVAAIRWRQRGGSLAVAASSEDHWTLKRGGFMNPHVTMRTEGSEAVRARLTVHLNHHEVALENGRVYRFRRAGVLVPAWKITTGDGGEVLHVEPVRSGRRLEGGAVLVAPTATDLPELLLLVVLSWYFIVLVWFEDEALVELESTGASAAAGGPES